MTEAMIRRYYPTPGCFARLVAFIVAGPVGFTLTAIVLTAAGDHIPGRPFIPFLCARGGYVFAARLFLRAWSRLSAYVVPSCPHCGAETNPSFRICGNCRRVK